MLKSVATLYCSHHHAKSYVVKTIVLYISTYCKFGPERPCGELLLYSEVYCINSAKTPHNLAGGTVGHKKDSTKQ